MNDNDLNVAKFLNSDKTGVHGNLQDGFVIKEELYEFERQEFFDGKMSAMLPKKFVDMPEELKRIKYPSEQRPQIIKMCPEAGIDFSFSFIDVMFTNDQIALNLEVMQNTLKKTNPAIKMLDKDIVDLNGASLAWFDFISPAIDGRLYNIMYQMPVDGKMLHGVFNCIDQNMELWKPVAMEVIKSIRDMTLE